MNRLKMSNNDAGLCDTDKNSYLYFLAEWQSMIHTLLVVYFMKWAEYSAVNESHSWDVKSTFTK